MPKNMRILRSYACAAASVTRLPEEVEENFLTDIVQIVPSDMLSRLMLVNSFNACASLTQLTNLNALRYVNKHFVVIDPNT